MMTVVEKQRLYVIHGLFSFIKRHSLYLPSIAFSHATARRCFLLIRSPKAHKVGQIVLTPVPGNKNDGQENLSAQSVMRWSV